MTSKSKTTLPAPPPADHGTSQSNNLFISVKTFESAEGRCIGERIVDMCHYNTRNWLQKHLWWATHNGHDTEIKVCTPEEVAAHIESGKAALAAKFNSTSAPAELAAAA
jgi:hypothetical protein